MSRDVQADRSPELPSLVCACASVRRAARLVTQLYAREMGPQVEPSQFLLLSVLEKYPGQSQTSIGSALGFDKTTVSRNLRLLNKNGWIAPAQGLDRRERAYQLTSAGEQVLAATKPRWHRAQEKFREVMTANQWDAMFKAFDDAAKAALDVQVSSKPDN